MSYHLLVNVVLVVAGSVACLPVTVGEETFSTPPDNVASQEPYWELLLDDYAIAQSTGFERVIHQPTPRGIALKGEQAWKQNCGVTPLYVGRRRDGKYEMYYLAHGPLGGRDGLCHKQRWAQVGKTRLISARHTLGKSKQSCSVQTTT